MTSAWCVRAELGADEMVETLYLHESALSRRAK